MNTRLWEAAVVWMQSMTSVARPMADWKPKVVSVPHRSSEKDREGSPGHRPRPYAAGRHPLRLRPGAVLPAGHHRGPHDLQGRVRQYGTLYAPNEEGVIELFQWMSGTPSFINVSPEEFEP